MYSVDSIRVIWDIRQRQWVIRSFFIILGHILPLNMRARCLETSGSDYPPTRRHILVKVKGKVKVKFTLEQATKTQRGSIGIALLFL